MKLLRRLAYGCACAFGMHHLARLWNRRRLLIVCYHGVARPHDLAHWLLMPPAAFERQLAYLKRHYHVRPIDEALGDLQSGRLDSPTACVTFDDGYLNNLTEALPRLQRAGVPASVYLPTGLVGTNHRLWTTEIDLACAATGIDVLDVEAIIAQTPVPPDLPGRYALAERLKSVLKALPAVERRAAHQRLLAALAVEEPTDGGAFGIMDWSDVRRMEESGTITFGAHTVHHEIVSQLNETELEREIAGSMREVAARTTRPSSIFAYPNGGRGDFDPRSAAAVAAAGGIAALSTIEGLNSRDADPFALRRITVGGNITDDEFRVRVSGLREQRIR